MAALSGSADARNYWFVLKNRLKKAGDEVLTKCKGFKLLAPDGKRRMTDCFDASGIVELAKRFPGNKATPFLDWFLYSDRTIDGRSKQKAYQLFESGLLESVEVGTAKGLRQIYAYLFGGLYDFAGRFGRRTSPRADSRSRRRGSCPRRWRESGPCRKGRSRKSSKSTLK